MNLPFLAPSSKPDNATAPRDPWPFYPDLDDSKEDDKWNEPSIWEQFYIAPLDTKRYEPEACCGAGRNNGQSEQRKKAA